jgi:hypothetical protein
MRNVLIKGRNLVGFSSMILGALGCTMDDKAPVFLGATTTSATAGTGGQGGSAATGGKGGAAGTTTSGAATGGKGGGAGTATSAATGGAGTSATGGSGGATGGTGGAGGDGTGGSAGGDDAGVPPTDDGGTPPGTSDLGKACETDDQCAGGLTCLKSTDTALYNSGGPANGYCTLDCTGNDSVCATYGGNCQNFAATTDDPFKGYCMLNCEYGSADRSNKCLGRADVGCSSDTFSCMPVCGQDSDCPSGRLCDPGTGVCVDTLKAGDLLGSHCQSSDTCAATCIQNQSDTGQLSTFCSGSCVLGRTDGCHYKQGSLGGASSQAGFCLFGLPNAQLGDVGFCAQLCDRDNQCRDKTDPGGFCSHTYLPTHGWCSFGPGSTDAGND